MSEWSYARRQIYHAIALYIGQHGYGPSVRDIAAMIGVVSTGHVEHHLKALEAEGKITREPHVARSIRLTGGA